MAQSVTHCEVFTEFEKQSAISRAWNSIRTRYSLATAFLLLLALTVFYIGGRIVLVHMLRDTEQQVKEIGSDISRIAYHNTEHVRKALLDSVEWDGGESLAVNDRYSVCGRFAPDGSLISASCRDVFGKIVAVDAVAIAPYAATLREWCETTMRRGGRSATTGIIRLGGRSHYVALAKGDGKCVLLGAPFETNVFTSQVNEGLSGLDIKITNRKAELTAAIVPNREIKRTRERSDFGIAPMFSEAINFYSGGFWDIGASQFEAVYAVRDIAGNAVSMVAVSIPKTFSSATQAALGRLAFFVAMVGLVFVLPIFWFQSWVLLNPLTRMTQAIANLGMMHRDTDCPHIDWKGKDEFALLAASVNRMLETISSRAIAVAQSESRQRALIDAIPDALAVFDRQHRLVTMTKDSSDKNGIPFAVPGEEFPELMFGKEGKANFDDALDRVFDGKDEVRSIRLELQHAKWVPDSQPSRFFDVRIVKMDEMFVLALIRDITDIVIEHRQLVGAKEKLREVEKRQSLALLAAGIAHDINNILTIIGNTTASTWLETSDEEEIKAVNTISDALRRGSMMMRELMDYAGESRIIFERESPKKVIDDIEGILRGLLSESVDLELNVPEGLPAIDAGRNQLFKVFMNIVKNAVEAIGKRPGRIVIAAKRKVMTQEELMGFRSATTLKAGEGVLFTISDNGPGIRPDILRRLFDPYVSSKSLGRGLGLATVSSVVEAHGGGIRVDSVVERGTTFKIFLPESRLPEPSTASPASRNDSGNGCHEARDVLVVDDEEFIRKTSAMLLKALKYTPYTAKDGAEALGVVRRLSESLSAIVLDASLGDVDTVRLAMSFRKNAPTVPIVISSGSSEEYIRKMFESVKINAVLSKPYTLAEMKSVLDGVCA